MSESPQSMAILVAEDNPVNQKIIVAMLTKMGYRVDVAINGAEAVEAADRGGYALILMDCQMPVMDGYEATKAIRGRETTGTRVPILALSANSIGEQRERCSEAGIDDFVAKPIRYELLQEKIVQWTQASRDDR
ncbi:MAG: response regulator [Gammaproteobacteria bacterium]|nr:response regulator [Gammaproteobacteria bacterium]